MLTAEDFQNNIFDNSSGHGEYYDEISYGNFTVDGACNGWYQSSYSFRARQKQTQGNMYRRSLNYDPDVDYSLFDNDGPDNIPNSGDDDGYVDGIAVVYSVCGAEWGPGNDNLWPHMSSLGAYESIRQMTLAQVA